MAPRSIHTHPHTHTHTHTHTHRATWTQWWMKSGIGNRLTITVKTLEGFHVLFVSLNINFLKNVGDLTKNKFQFIQIIWDIMRIFPECWQSQTEQPFQAFALTPKPPPSPSPQGFLASLAARSSAPAVRKHWLSLAARPRLVTGQRRSEGHFSVNLLNYLFSSRLRIGVELCLRLGETLDPLHLLTWLILNHMSRAFHANSWEFEELVLTGEAVRIPGSRSAGPQLYLGTGEGQL